MYYQQIDQDIEVDICQTRSVKEKKRLEKIKQDSKMGFMTTNFCRVELSLEKYYLDPYILYSLTDCNYVLSN